MNQPNSHFPDYGKGRDEKASNFNSQRLRRVTRTLNFCGKKEAKANGVNIYESKLSLT